MKQKRKLGPNYDGILRGYCPLKLVVHVTKLPVFCYCLVAFGNGLRKKQQNEVRNTLNLSGIWQFKKDSTDVREKENWRQRRSQN